MSHYSVNASVPKTLIAHLIRWTIRTGQFDKPTSAVLQSIVETEISPELVPGDERGARPAQATEDVVGPFELQDFFLYYISRFGFRPSRVGVPGRARLVEPARGTWPDGCRRPNGTSTIARRSSAIWRSSCNGSSRPASSNGRRCRTRRRSGPAGRCRRGATGAPRAMATPTRGSTSSRAKCLTDVHLSKANRPFSPSPVCPLTSGCP